MNTTTRGIQLPMYQITLSDKSFEIDDRDAHGNYPIGNKKASPLFTQLSQYRVGFDGFLDLSLDVPNFIE
jgi:hypothetical protein